MGAYGGRSRRETVAAQPRRSAHAPGADARGNARVRRERAGAAVATVAESALAARGCRQLRVDGHAARADPQRGRARTGRRGGRLHGPRPRHPRRCRASLRTEPRSRRCTARRSASRVRRQRRTIAATARLSASRDRPRLVRNDAREVVERDHGPRRGFPGLAARGRIPAPTIRGRAGDAGDADAPAIARRAAGDSRLPVAPALRRGRAMLAGGACVVGLGPDRAGRGERGRR